MLSSECNDGNCIAIAWLLTPGRLGAPGKCWPGEAHKNIFEDFGTSVKDKVGDQDKVNSAV